MHILYLRLADDIPYRSPLLGKRKYDAMYVDAEQDSGNLELCLEQLGDGDTLYIERESCLAQSMVGAVGILRGLALRGVNVWCERTKKLLRSKTSPFLNLTEELAQAVVDFRNAFMRFRQKQGITAAKARGCHLGKPRVEVPENFEQQRLAWKRKEVTLVKAASECRMSVTTFWKRCQEAEQNMSS